MDFTGERFIPDAGLGGEIEIEHYQRYLGVLDLVEGGVVLDAACGEGYGSDILARRARLVCGLEIDSQATSLARKRYQHPNLHFTQGSIASLPFADACFDRLVSFETIEHVNEALQNRFLTEIKRVLTPDGILIMSTPDKLIYSDRPNYRNEFHVKEFYRQEYYDFLSKHFKHVEFWEQTETLAYALTREDMKNFRHLLGEGISLQGKYIVALCSDAKIEKSLTGTIVLDREDLYHKKVARVIELQDEIEEKNLHIRIVQKDISGCEGTIKEMRKMISSLEEMITAQQAQIDALHTEIENQRGAKEHCAQLLATKEAHLKHIASTRGWRLLQLFYKMASIIPRRK